MIPVRFMPESSLPPKPRTDDLQQKPAKVRESGSIPVGSILIESSGRAASTGRPP
jgi:hypothetical protein